MLHELFIILCTNVTLIMNPFTFIKVMDSAVLCTNTNSEQPIHCQQAAPYPLQQRPQQSRQPP